MWQESVNSLQNFLKKALVMQEKGRGSNGDKMPRELTTEIVFGSVEIV